MGKGDNKYSPHPTTHSPTHRSLTPLLRLLTPPRFSLTVLMSTLGRMAKMLLVAPCCSVGQEYTVR